MQHRAPGARLLCILGSGTSPGQQLGNELHALEVIVGLSGLVNHVTPRPVVLGKLIGRNQLVGSLEKAQPTLVGVGGV